MHDYFQSLVKLATHLGLLDERKDEYDRDVTHVFSASVDTSGERY